MKRIIAILTKKGALCDDLQKNTDVNIFKMEGGRVVEYENIKLADNAYQSFSLILTSKKISLIYMNHVGEELKKIAKKAGCVFKSREDFGDDEFIKQFVFS
jgi:hypothetical protein